MLGKKKNASICDYCNWKKQLTQCPVCLGSYCASCYKKAHHPKCSCGYNGPSCARKPEVVCMECELRYCRPCDREVHGAQKLKQNKELPQSKPTDKVKEEEITGSGEKNKTKGDHDDDDYEQDDYEADEYDDDDFSDGGKGVDEQDEKNAAVDKADDIEIAGYSKHTRKAIKPATEAHLIEAFTKVQKRFYGGPERAEKRMANRIVKTKLKEQGKWTSTVINYHQTSAKIAAQIDESLPATRDGTARCGICKGEPTVVCHQCNILLLCDVCDQQIHSGTDGSHEEHVRVYYKSPEKTPLPLPLTVLKRDGYGSGRVILKCQCCQEECKASIGPGGIIEIDNSVHNFMSHQKEYKKMQREQREGISASGHLMKRVDQHDAKMKRLRDQVKDRRRNNGVASYHAAYEAMRPKVADQRAFIRSRKEVYEEDYYQVDGARKPSSNMPLSKDAILTKRQLRILRHTPSRDRLAATMKMDEFDGTHTGHALRRRGSRYSFSQQRRGSLTQSINNGRQSAWMDETAPEFGMTEAQWEGRTEGKYGNDSDPESEVGSQQGNRIAKMLEDLDLVDDYDYLDVLRASSITFEELVEMDDDELKKFFPKLGPRSRVKRYLAYAGKQLKMDKLRSLAASATRNGLGTRSFTRTTNELSHDHHHHHAFEVKYTASRCEHHALTSIRRPGERLSFRSNVDYHTAKAAQVARDELRQIEEEEERKRDPRLRRTGHSSWIEEETARASLARTMRLQNPGRKRSVGLRRNYGHLDRSEVRTLRELHSMEYNLRDDGELEPIKKGFSEMYLDSPNVLDQRCESKQDVKSVQMTRRKSSLGLGIQDEQGAWEDSDDDGERSPKKRNQKLNDSDNDGDVYNDDYESAGDY